MVNTMYARRVLRGEPGEGEQAPVRRLLRLSRGDARFPTRRVHRHRGEHCHRLLPRQVHLVGFETQSLGDGTGGRRSLTSPARGRLTGRRLEHRVRRLRRGFPRRRLVVGGVDGHSVRERRRVRKLVFCPVAKRGELALEGYVRVLHQALADEGADARLDHRLLHPRVADGEREEAPDELPDVRPRGVVALGATQCPSDEIHRAGVDDGVLRGALTDGRRGP